LETDFHSIHIIMTHPTYDEKTFHRNFEQSHGYLTPEQFPPIDWAEKKQLEMLFPAYKREQLAVAARREKISKIVDIGAFDLKTPDRRDDLFVGARLYIEPHKRCAVFGINGSGKTTLFEAISGGEIREFPKSMHVHHMKELEHHEDAEKISVLETVICSHPLRRVLVCMEEHLKNLIDAEEDAARKAKLEENLAYVVFLMRGIDGYTCEKRAKGMLGVLGFDDEGFVSPISSLSGGLRMRVALASAFIIDPELLLLDEPTNHLDMPSVLWLENRLRGYKGSYLLVTHDRTLLENVVTSVVLIQDQILHYFDCGFKEFEKRKEKLDVEQEKKIDKFLAKHRNVTSFQPEFRTKKNYQEWLRLRNERKVMLAGKFTFKAPAPLPTATPDQSQADVSLIKIDNVRFSYDNGVKLPFIFDTPISYEVKVGTRVGVMGPNGAGKSTFLKLITGKIQPTTGTITANPNYTLAYFGQHSTKELKLDMTPLEFMCESFPKSKKADLSAHLTKTSISDGPKNTRMRDLSFSQRSCVIFAKLTYVPPHLLILDEPTNFLDLESVDSLIQAVNKFQGGLITVTHNRDFLKRCSKNFLSIVPGAFLEFPTMKAAERATYSFITALEEGRDIDVKKAIVQNRGGGAKHTEEEQADRAARLAEQQDAAAIKENAAKAEADRLAKLAAEKEERRKAKLAAQRTDWAAGETCWAPVKGKFVQATVMRNIPNMGVTVQLASGKNVMVEAKRLRAEKPDTPAEEKKPQGGQQQGSGRGGRGGSRGGRGGPRGGGRGASRGGRGGNRGGRGGRRQ
jgi:ATP-binding cassette subfamily F protein 3